MSRRFEIVKTVTFEAAHRLPARPGERGGAIGYDRVHGHSFELEAALAGPADPERGWVADLAELADALEELRGELDHNMLNDVLGAYPATLEGVCQWAADRLGARFGNLSRVACARPSLRERCELRLG